MRQDNQQFKNDIVDMLNSCAETTNKALMTLNSGAFVAFLHFWPTKDPKISSLTNACVSPIKLFAFGLTAILLTAACNYFSCLMLHHNSEKDQNKVLFWIGTISAVISGLSFLIGIWIIATQIAV